METCQKLVRSARIAAAASACIGFSSAQAAGKLDEILARGYLIVGTGSTFAPWSFKDDSGSLVGFDIDIAKILAKGLFDDPEKVQFVSQGADARIPSTRPSTISGRPAPP